MTLKTLTLALTVAGAGILAGCSSPSIVTKSDGSQTVTADAPEYDKRSNTYSYEEDGRKVQVNKDRVDRIEEVK